MRPPSSRQGRAHSNAHDGDATLDALHRGPKWPEASAPELQRRVLDKLEDAPGWVVDGNYDSKLGTVVLDRADLVVWIDLPLTTKLVRLARRTAKRWYRREELWNGNRETLRGLFWGGEGLFAWAVTSHFRHHRHWPLLLQGRPFVRLRTAREVDAWFSEFCEQLRRQPTV